MLKGLDIFMKVLAISVFILLIYYFNKYYGIGARRCCKYWYLRLVRRLQGRNSFRKKVILNV